MKREAGPDSSTQDDSYEKFVILLRHGIAEEKSADKPDEDRELTSKGNQSLKLAARGLAAAFPKADAILSSPLVRTIQTGVWVIRAYDRKLTLQTTEALRHEKSPNEIIELVKGLDARRVILVGHEPHLTRTMAHWTGLGVTNFELKKGGCYGLRVGETGLAILEWLLPPRILRRID